MIATISNQSNCSALTELGKPIVKIDQIPDDLEFVVDSQDVSMLFSDLMKMEEIAKTDLVDWKQDYDSFFVEREDGSIVSVYGIHGIIPWLNKNAYLIFSV